MIALARQLGQSDDITFGLREAFLSHVKHGLSGRKRGGPDHRYRSG
ncbi:hypothetical protein D8I24_0171 (plasmid) [Cupriavidus necator H850]|nr:hypothetical protein D8I24_0171 [Cupriavidus necator H850]